MIANNNPSMHSGTRNNQLLSQSKRIKEVCRCCGMLSWVHRRFSMVWDVQSQSCHGHQSDNRERKQSVPYNSEAATTSCDGRSDNIIITNVTLPWIICRQRKKCNASWMHNGKSALAMQCISCSTLEAKCLQASLSTALPQQTAIAIQSWMCSSQSLMDHS